MERIRNAKGMIFDLDGTLLNSMVVWEQIDMEFLGKRGLEAPEDYLRDIATLGFDGAAKYTIETFGLEESPGEIIREWYAMAFEAYAHEVGLKPGAKEYLHYLKDKGVQLGIATSCEERMFLPALKNNGIYELFGSYTTVNEVARGKLFPDIYERQAGKMGLKPGECVVFEDILGAVQSAKSGGFYTVGVYDAHSADDRERIMEHADKYIYSYEELMR